MQSTENVETVTYPYDVNNSYAQIKNVYGCKLVRGGKRSELKRLCKYTEAV